MTIQLNPVKSSQIAAIGHDPATNTLAIRFNGGNKLYHYEGVTVEEFAKLQGADSIGKHFGTHIRAKFKHTLQDEKNGQAKEK